MRQGRCQHSSMRLVSGSGDMAASFGLVVTEAVAASSLCQGEAVSTATVLAMLQPAVG